MIKCRLFTLRRRQSEHVSDNCSLNFTDIWCNSIIYSDLLWGHEGDIIVLNAVTTEFLTVVDKGNRSWFQRVQNLIYNILVLVHWVRWVVYTRFKDRVVLLRLIFLNDCFRLSDLDVFLITASLLSLILEGRDVTTVTNDIHRTQIVTLRFFCVRISCNVASKPCWRLRGTQVRAERW